MGTSFCLFDRLKDHFKSEGDRRGFALPQPQTAQVRVMRTLLVSADLSPDIISATGGCQGFVPTRGMIPLDPSPGEVTWMDFPTIPACFVGDYER